MHQSSYDKMEKFKEKYLDDRTHTKLIIIDIGSYDFNGSYKPIFNNPLWKYIGVDMEHGKNVDIVIKSLYKWTEIPSNFADVVISGQTFEHIEYPWRTMKEIRRILKPNAISCIIVPSSGPEHRFPLDCWRIYPDGLNAIAKFADMDIVETYCQYENQNYQNDGSNMWKDSVLIAKKPNSPGLKSAVYDLFERYL